MEKTLAHSELSALTEPQGFCCRSQTPTSCHQKGPASLTRICPNREPGFHLKHNPDQSSHAAALSGAMLGDGHVATCSPYHSQTQGGFCPELGLKKLENKEESCSKSQAITLAAWLGPTPWQDP